ncbi:MAG TPA: nickel pincer cofactor biosynthesis protein LarB [Pseudomonadales bacterium]|jgi:NCAIR mutase (PurE)-related protein|nr:nickel pincer cofactor biosynthesis protein LarB [Pseudomonadales bacterium]
MNEDIARLDHGRLERQGFPEVVMASGKTPEHVAQIMAEFTTRAGRALATRATETQFAAVAALLPEARFDTRSRLITLGRLEALEGMERHVVAVASGGTSDLPIAEECAQTLEWASVRVERFYDIGVAYLERLLSVETRLRSATVCVVVAGMEGALPSVLGGRVACPMIAVPTSVGYGANFSGLSALLGMLTSCVPGVTVVNIDNGFGAAAAANRILRSMVHAAR